MRTHRTEHQLDCATRHRTRCTAQPRLQQPRPPLRAASRPRPPRTPLLAPTLHALTRISTLSSSRTPLILSPHRRRPLETPALSPPPSARSAQRSARATPYRRSTPPDNSAFADTLATLRTTTHSTRAQLMREAEPGHKRHIDRPTSCLCTLPSTPLTHEAKALKDTRVLPLIHCICTAETHRLDSCSLLTALRSHAASLLSGRPLLPPLHPLLNSQPSHSSSASRISNHWKPIESPLATAFPRQRLLRARRPRTRRVDGRASTPVDAAMSGCRRTRSLHTEANYCLTELIYLAELAPVSATTRHGTIATRRDLPPPLAVQPLYYDALPPPPQLRLILPSPLTYWTNISLCLRPSHCSSCIAKRHELLWTPLRRFVDSLTLPHLTAAPHSNTLISHVFACITNNTC